MSASPNLKLPYLDPNQNQKSVTHNAALTVLDALVNLHVASTTLQAPPAAPSDGRCWIVAPGATGAWTGKDLNIAAWQDGAWAFYPPNPGFVAYVDALQSALMWNGTAWVSLLGAITALSLADLGIGTAADPANPLSAKLNAALFAALPTSANPPGTGDVRLKLSKQAAANTASLLLQDNFAGRAEIGLLADDNLHIKVSPDGTAFTDALVIAGQGGAAFALTPTAPTAPAGDASTKLATTAFVTQTVASAAARTQVADAAYTVAASDRTVAVTALTAARILTLPPASAYPPGVILRVVDESGACSGTNTITVARAGTDSVNGATAAVLASPYGYLALESNGANKWTVVDAPAPVASVAGRTGAVSLGIADIAGAAPLASPALAGTPTAPTAAPGTNSAQIATTSFVAAGFVTYAYAGATYATASNASLVGTPTAPTPPQNDASTKLATTAYADRAAAAGNLTRSQVNDANYVVQLTDRVVAVTALTGARTLTLPPASAYPPGATLTVVDESGACSGTNTITVARAGFDTVNGAAAAVLASPYGYLALESNGTNKWTVVDQAIAPSVLATVAQGVAGSQIQFGILEQLVTLSGASTSSTVQIPNRAIVFAVSSRTVAAVTGAPSYGVGVSGNATQFGGSLGTAVGSTNSGIIGPSGFYSATPIVITATSGSFTGGAVRIAIQYALFGAPTA